MIEGKKAEVVALKTLAEELKQGVPDIDKDYLTEKLADLDDTVAVLAKSCAKHQQELEEGLKRSNNFYDKLQKAIDSVNKKKQELAQISPASLDTPSVKAKLDELNVSRPLYCCYYGNKSLCMSVGISSVTQWSELSSIGSDDVGSTIEG